MLVIDEIMVPLSDCGLTNDIHDFLCLNPTLILALVAAYIDTQGPNQHL